MARPYIPLALRNRIIGRSQGCCEYCQSPARYSPEIFEIEHIVPLASGGKTEFGNLALACPACNRYKGSRQTAIDPETGAITPLFNPRSDVWSEHFRWHDASSRVIGISAVGRATVLALHMNRPAAVRFRKALHTLGLHPAILD